MNIDCDSEIFFVNYAVIGWIQKKPRPPYLTLNAHIQTATFCWTTRQ